MQLTKQQTRIRFCSPRNRVHLQWLFIGRLPSRIIFTPRNAFREHSVRSKFKNQGDRRGIQECTLLCLPRLHLGARSASSARAAPSRETPHRAPAVTSWSGVPGLGALAARSRRPAQLSAESPARPSPVQVLLNVLHAPARVQHTPQPAALS